MAWSAPSEWERWDPDKLIVCPYDPVHSVPAKRYQYHVIKCRENHPEKDFVSCPFNAKHIMLRPELRRHITRCPDRGEVEPYSFKGNLQDSEGFYFKGDTSVPCYKRQTALRTLEEDWDRDDEDTSSQQNLCQYYANHASIPAGSRQAVQDVSSLNPREREQFKRNMRTQAVQSQHSQHSQENLSESHPTTYVSSDHWNHRKAKQIDRSNGAMNIRREGGNASNSYPQSQWFQPLNSNHHNEVTNNTISKNMNFYPENTKNNGIPFQGHEKHETLKNYMFDSSDNRFFNDQHECQGSGCSTFSLQNNRHFNNAMDTNNYSMGVARPEMKGVENSTGIPSFNGAGRAKLAEEARRMNFGLRRSGAPVGRGRGILELFSSNSQG